MGWSGTDRRASNLNQGCGGETRLYDGSIVGDSRYGKTCIRNSRIHPIENLIDNRIPWDIQLISNGSNPP